MRRWKRPSPAKRRIGEMTLAFAMTAPPTHRVGGCLFGLDRVHMCRTVWTETNTDRRIAAVTDLSQFRKDLVGLLPRLRRFALTLTRNHDDGDDLVQAACERAIQRSMQFQSGTRLDSWLFTMMRNIWISEIRSRRVRTGQGVIDAADADELATPVGAADHIYGNQLIGMVLSLPEGLAACLLLVSVEGHSYQEAADILDIPIGTVMSRMSRARAMMKDLLAGAKAPGAEAMVQ
jgi:RNA polymerase sigma-70 factor, ECF subfamily